MLKGQLYHFVANSKDSFDEEAVYNLDNLDNMDDLGNMHISIYGHEKAQVLVGFS